MLTLLIMDIGDLWSLLNETTVYVLQSERNAERLNVREKNINQKLRDRMWDLGPAWLVIVRLAVVILRLAELVSPGCLGQLCRAFSPPLFGWLEISQHFLTTTLMPHIYIYSIYMSLLIPFPL